MAKEIERKFLIGDLARLARDLMSVRATPLLQGYLSKPDDLNVTRVRLAGDQSFLTIKSANVGISRNEFEYEIPRDDAVAMMAMTPYTIEKTRFKLPYRGHTFEIDYFHGRHEGLIMAEVDLTHADEAVELPEWIGREVTGDPQYYNSRMATQTPFDIAQPS